MKLVLFNFLEKLYPYKKFAVDDFTPRRRIYFLYTIITIFIFYLSYFILKNIQLGNLLLLSVDVSFFMFILILYIYLRISRKVYIVSLLFTITIAILMTFIFINGGHANSGFIYPNIFPMVAFFLLDKKRGAVAVFGALVIFIGVYLLRGYIPTFPAYNPTQLVRQVTVYLILCICSFSTESIIERLSDKVSKNYSTLNHVLTVKNNFFQMIAHDLRGPIGFYSESLDLLKNNISELSNDEVDEILVSMRESAHKNFTLLENLLNWVKVQGTSELIITQRVVKLNDLIRESIDILQPQATNKDIDLRFNFTGNYSIYVDPELVKSVIRNFISNAIKFSYRKARIDITVQLADFGALCCIADSGVGIPLQRQEKIFKLDNYFTTTGTESEKGSGLGLVICKDFITKCGGEIGFTSVPNEGSSFFFQFPLYNRYIV